MYLSILKYRANFFEMRLKTEFITKTFNLNAFEILNVNPSASNF
jgi:hypothetical protein